MKNKFLYVTILIIFVCTSSYAFPFKKDKTRPSLEQRQNNYIEIQEELNLTERELEKFEKIRAMEEDVVRPIALKLEANLLRLDELNKVSCRIYQRKCKKELKKNKAFLTNDIKEFKRQIWQKKEYFKVLYINETTRTQGLSLRELIKNTTNGKIQMW